MKYPIINRDNIDFISDTEICNLGFVISKLKDGRPIRCEKWFSHNVEMVTIFLSTINLENELNSIKKLLVNNKIIDIIQDKIYLDIVVDENNNEFYALNIPLSNNDVVYNKFFLNVEDYS